VATDFLETNDLLDGAAYARFRISSSDPATLRCEDVERVLRLLERQAGERLAVEKIAESYQGRPIYLARVGSGPRRVLMWSQMHGDEPTHTAVLLDLLSYLTRCAEAPAAAAILAGCTVYAIPMLNPDGAAAVTRFNAQHIDVNRDAQRLESPEGRALAQAVEELRPEFGFNLHNQNARAAYGVPPRPAAVALMAPPIDADETETAQIRAAKQVAVSFAESVEPLAAGMVGRYVAEYMPWAFGEWIQATGVVTLLVEAGGWPGPDPTPLVEVHLVGLAATLRSIATGSYQHVDPRSFDRLPRENELKLFDTTIVGARLLDGDFRAPVRADLGINHSHGHRLAMTARADGRIVEVGDLGTATGKTVMEVSKTIALPGRVAFLSDWGPGLPLGKDKIDVLLASGVTLVVGAVDLADRPVGESANLPLELPFNWAFADSGKLQQPTAASTFAELAAANWQSYQMLGLGVNRGKIRREYFADLAMYDTEASCEAVGAVRRVVVAGETVWVDGNQTGKNVGRWLGHAAEIRSC